MEIQLLFMYLDIFSRHFKSYHRLMVIPKKNCAFFLLIINLRFQLFFDTAPLTELPGFQITVTLKNLLDFSKWSCWMLFG